MRPDRDDDRRRYSLLVCEACALALALIVLARLLLLAAWLWPTTGVSP